MSKDFLPRSDNAILDWCRQFILIIYDQLYYDRWGIKKPPEELKELYDDYATKLDECKQNYRRTVDVVAKNVAKKKMIKVFRNFVQGYLARNVNVTEEDRRLMGLPQRDTILTPVPQPVTQVEGTLIFCGLGLIEMRNIRSSTDKPDARVRYGVRIYYGIMGDAPAETGNTIRLSVPPTHGRELPNSVFTRRSRYLFDFTAKRGMEVFFCMRYENSKGEAGPWGKIISAHVP